MWCEISIRGGGSTGNTLLEAASLQKETSNLVFCQCSIIHPSSSGGLLGLTAPSSPLTCSVIAKRCQ